MKNIKKLIICILNLFNAFCFCSEIKNNIETLNLKFDKGKFYVSISASDCHYTIDSICSSSEKLKINGAWILTENSEGLKFVSGKWKSEENKIINYQIEENFKGVESELFSSYEVIEFNDFSNDFINSVSVPFFSDVNRKIENSILGISCKSLYGASYLFLFKINNFFIKNEAVLSESRYFNKALKYLSEEKKFSVSLNFDLNEKFVPLETVYYFLLNGSEDFELKKACSYFAKLLIKSIKNETGEINGKKVWTGSNLCDKSFYLKQYFTFILNKNYPVYSSSIYAAENDYFNYIKEPLSDSEKNRICKAAEYFLNDCIEYYLKPDMDGKIYFKNQVWNKIKKWNGEENTSGIKFYERIEREGISGNPIPFVKNGIDTPETFFVKLKFNNLLNKKYPVDPVINQHEYSLGAFLPGGRKNDFYSCGTDGFGMFTACLYLSELENKIFSYNKKYAAKKLKDFASKIYRFNKSYISEKLNLNNLNCRFEIEDLDFFTCLISDYGDVSKGDILTACADGKSCLAVVVKAENPKSKEDISVVVIPENYGEIAKKCLWSELEDCDFYSARRILKFSNASVLQNNFFDFMDENIECGEISFLSMKEQCQASNEFYRWIPNTGEWLVLSNYEICLRNKSGAELDVLDDMSEVDFFLMDRFFSSAKKASAVNDLNGNVYCNNPGGKFEISFETEKGEFISYGIFSNVGKEMYAFSKASSFNDTIFLLKNGKLFLSSGNFIFKVLIRPLSYETAFHGDDLFINLFVKKGTQKIEILSDEKSYVCVYDKKLLWRGNLYINQDEDSGVDWNDIHPWNVPPSKNNIVTFSKEKWWNESWGFNEWNRSYDGTQNVNIIDELNAAGGGQCVTFQEFTPLRTIPSNENFPDERNRISRTTAYSYPEHTAEPEKGLAGSMDSPFDFLWKLNYQREARKLFLQKDGIKEVSWAASENKWNNYKKYQDFQNEELNPKFKIIQSFIPQFGLYVINYRLKSNFAEKDVPENISHEKNYESGTDCIGFVQRCASYSGNKYLWPDLPKGIMETNSTDYEEVLKKYGNKNIRSYPNSCDDLETGYVNQYAVDIIKIQSEKTGLADEKNNKENLSKIRCIVPGDIVVKNSSNSISYELRDHIAMIAYVPPDSMNLSLQELMEKIIVIESTYTQQIQTVIKKFSLDDYLKSENQRPFKIYGDDVFIGKGFQLFVRQYAVRRLK